jgi:hypothetical protein
MRKKNPPRKYVPPPKKRQRVSAGPIDPNHPIGRPAPTAEQQAHYDAFTAAVRDNPKLNNDSGRIKNAVLVKPAPVRPRSPAGRDVPPPESKVSMVPYPMPNNEQTFDAWNNFYRRTDDPPAPNNNEQARRRAAAERNQAMRRMTMQRDANRSLLDYPMGWDGLQLQDDMEKVQLHMAKEKPPGASQNASDWLSPYNFMNSASRGYRMIPAAPRRKPPPRKRPRDE